MITLKVARNFNLAAFTKGEENDAYFNQATLLIEGNGVIDIDYASAYKYLNFVAAKGHTYGTYMFGINIQLINFYSNSSGWSNFCYMF